MTKLAPPLRTKPYLIVRLFKYLIFSIIFFGIAVVSLVLIYRDYLMAHIIQPQIALSIESVLPQYKVNLGALHYSFSDSFVSCDSVLLQAKDNSLNVTFEECLISDVDWFAIVGLGKHTIGAQLWRSVSVKHTSVELLSSGYVCGGDLLRLNMKDSSLSIQNAYYRPQLDDEAYFDKLKTRKCRYRATIPQLHIDGLNVQKLIEARSNTARSLHVNDLSLDVALRKYMPSDTQTTRTPMPVEQLAALQQWLRIDSVVVTVQELRYSEQFKKRGPEAFVTFNRIAALVTNIDNRPTLDSSIHIEAQGYLMDNGLMKVKLDMPFTPQDFSMHVSGSLSSMNLKLMNNFVEVAEHRRISDGVFKGAQYTFDAKDGRSRGTVAMQYKDLYVKLLDKKNGSEKGLGNRITSFLANLLVLHSSNLPEKGGAYRVGKVAYTRQQNDTFVQFIWYSLSGAIGPIVGF